MVDESFHADESVDIDFEIFTSKTTILADEEMLNPILMTVTTSSRMKSKMTKILKHTMCRHEIERWSLSDKDGDDIRRKLNSITKKNVQDIIAKEKSKLY